MTAGKTENEQAQRSDADPKNRGALADEAFTLESVRALAQVMKDYDLGELELSRASGERLRIKSRRAEIASVLPAQRAVVAAEPAPAAAPSPGRETAKSSTERAKEQGLTVITAPLVGTFYRSPSPETPSFVEVGQRVRKGQTLCIIEAMKLMNELESDVEGTVVAVLGENGRPVEYGEPLFHIKVG